MQKNYIARAPDVDVIHTSNMDDPTTAVAEVIYQVTDLEVEEVPDIEGYQKPM